MRLLHGVALITGGVAVGTCALLLAAWMGSNNGGVVVAIVGVMAGIVLVEQGMQKW